MRLLAITRREIALSASANTEVFVAEPSRWGEAFEAHSPQALICALGTTWRKAAANEAAFRAVDHELVLRTVRAAIASGVRRMVVVSSAGASSSSKSFYLRVKGELERDLATLGFDRLDILRPGLLRGQRGGDRRLKERAAILASPLTDRLLRGPMRRYRSIPAKAVARAAVALALKVEQGRFVHDNDMILLAGRSLPQPVGA